MITKEQVEAAEKTIEADKVLVAQYKEYIRQNLHNELSDILCRIEFMGFSNIVVNEVIARRDGNLSIPSDFTRFTIELQCTSFNE
jgi:hypothetical protein